MNPARPRWIALLVAALLGVPIRLGAAQQLPGIPRNPRPMSPPDHLDKSYLDLFQVAPTAHVTSGGVPDVREDWKPSLTLSKNGRRIWSRSGNRSLIAPTACAVGGT